MSVHHVTHLPMYRMSHYQHLYTTHFPHLDITPRHPGYLSTTCLPLNICTPHYVFTNTSYVSLSMSVHHVFSTSRHPPEMSRVSVPQCLDIIPRYLEMSPYTTSRVSLNTVHYVNYTTCVSHLYRPSPSLIPLYSKHLSPLYT